MNCPNCGTTNDANNRFCLKCGAPLTAAPAPQTTYTNSAPQITYVPPPNAPPPAPPQTGWTTPTQPVYQPPYPPPQTYQPPSSYPPVQQPYVGMPGLSALNIWGPFAGFGTRRRHVGWLMNGQGERAPELVTKVEAKFRERAIPGVYLNKENLTARGVGVETRPYFILRRGLASLALYINQFGRDLFISQASYLKPPISNFRAIVAGAMLVFQGYMTFIYPFALNSSFGRASGGFGLFGSSGGALDAIGGMLFLICLIGPLGALNSLALFILFCFSAYKWLMEKDFLAALRVSPNEFNEDDLMAMEKAVEETVRQSLTDIKLNPDDLEMATAGGGAGRQLF